MRPDGTTFESCGGNAADAAKNKGGPLTSKVHSVAMSVLAVLFYVLAIRLDVLVRRRTSRERIDVESFVGSPPASPQSCCSDIELRTRASFFKGAPPSPSPSRSPPLHT